MHPCSRPPTWSADLSTRRRRYRARYAIAALAAFTFATACATKPAGPPSSGWVSFPLQATSEQPAPRVLVPPPISAAQPSPQCVTGPWMEEQLRKFDDRYAGAAADIRMVLEQALASMRAVATAADLKPITAGVGKVNADLTTIAARIDSLATGLQAPLKDLERKLAELAARQAAPPAPAATASDSLSDALMAIQATPRQTLQLRAWLESHPNHPKTPEALFQLGMAFLDSGYPSAARHYLTRLIDGYGSSLQAAEAKAHLDSLAKSAAKATPKPGPEAPVRARKSGGDSKRQAAVATSRQEVPPAPASELAPGEASVSAPGSSAGRLVSPQTGLQSHPADATSPGSSSLSPAVKDVK